jgi:hypothetical protein
MEAAMLERDQALALAEWMLRLMDGFEWAAENSSRYEQVDTAAKREIVALLLDSVRSRHPSWPVLAEVVQLLARAYSDTPGYRREWCMTLTGPSACF